MPTAVTSRRVRHGAWASWKRWASPDESAPPQRPSCPLTGRRKAEGSQLRCDCSEMQAVKLGVCTVFAVALNCLGTACRRHVRVALRVLLEAYWALIIMPYLACTPTCLSHLLCYCAVIVLAMMSATELHVHSHHLPFLLFRMLFKCRWPNCATSMTFRQTL